MGLEILKFLMSAGINVEELVRLMVISFYEKNSLFLKNGDKMDMYFDARCNTFATVFDY